MTGTFTYSCPIHTRAGLLDLLRHVTGMTTTRRRSIKVDLMKDPHGAIVAHVCANSISLPKDVFVSSEQSFQMFSDAMVAVIKASGKSYNTV